MEHTSAGLFAYPMLVAVDILLYRPRLMPVEEDQRQYPELAHDLAQRFNSRYKRTSVVPDPHIMEDPARIYDLQGPTSKMNKSGVNPKGIVNLLDGPKVSVKCIRSAITDNDGEIHFSREDRPGASSLLVIQSVLTDKPVDKLVTGYEGVGYGRLKADTADTLETFTMPLRAHYEEPTADRDELKRILAEDTDHAREVAVKTPTGVYERVEFLKVANR